MTEIFEIIGFASTVFILWLLIIGIIERFLEWFVKYRKYNCKIKCLCKHTYKIYWFDGFGEMGIECITCGKKNVLHFDEKSLKELVS